MSAGAVQFLNRHTRMRRLADKMTWHAGAKRGVKALPGVEEDVGMIGLHWGEEFIELVPWSGRVTWQVPAVCDAAPHTHADGTVLGPCFLNSIDGG